MRDFELFADTDGDIGNGGTTSLGMFTAVQHTGSLAEPAQTFSFLATRTRFVHMEITSNYGSAENRVNFAEVAFNAVPEPASWVLVICGKVGSVLIARRR